MKWIVVIVFAFASNFTQLLKDDQYVCLPCGLECDSKEFDKPGTCPTCQMTLVRKSTVVFKTVSASEICEFISKNPSAVLLDCRTREEFEGTSEMNFGTLKNAINIPIGEIQNRLSEIEQYKNKEILVFCSHSHRSPQVAYQLTQNGFKKVTNMSGGMSLVTDTTCKK